MANLIPLERAKTQLNLLGCDDNTILFLISAASNTIEKYCNRKFSKQDYDELYTVSGQTNFLFVNNPPINQVYRIRNGQLPAVQIFYRDNGNQSQRADVEVTNTGVNLYRMFNQALTTYSFSFVSYPTFNVLSTAINAISGWTSTLNNQFAYWNTNDLKFLGVWNARNTTVSLMIFWAGLNYYRTDNDKGSIYCDGFIRGYQNHRVEYSGGFDPIPEDIQLAVGTLVQATYLALKQNPNLQSETLDKYSYTRATEQTFANLGIAFKQTLNNYRIININQYV